VLVALAAERRAMYESDERMSSSGPSFPDHVGTAERVVQEPSVPVDARHPPPQKQLLAEHLLPQRLHLGALGEEPVPAESKR